MVARRHPRTLALVVETFTRATGALADPMTEEEAASLGSRASSLSGVAVMPSRAAAEKCSRILRHELSTRELPR